MDEYGSGLFDFDDDNDELNDEQEGFFNMGSYRDSTLFLVDCTESMFVKADNEDDENDDDDDDGNNAKSKSVTLFQKCMRAILNMYQLKIYGSDRDFLGIVFFGTHKNNTGEDFTHIYMIQDLDQPSAERIKEIESIIDYSSDKFRKEYGHSNSFAMDKVLWYCSNMFSTITQKLDTKRIMLFTNNEHPHQSNKTLEKLAKNKAKDLCDIGIALELVPLVNKGDKFDYTRFYGDMLMLSDEQIKALPDPAENFEELERAVRSKDHKRRPYTHLNLSIGDQLSISCSVFNMIRKCPKPSKAKFDRKTNVETKTITRRYVPETGEILFNSDTKLAIDVCQKRVTFEQEEVKAIKRFDGAGLKLLGFKSMSSLKPYIYVKPGHFLYPDEKQVQGSSTLFSALLKKCLEKEKYILCEMTARANTTPRMVALYPQEEELDEHKIQLVPTGFHVYYLPYADDFRQIDRKIEAKPSEDNMDLLRKCINKLKFKYNPEDFKNPAIQKMWSEIEAVALDRETTEEFPDLTIPNNERIEKRAGEYLSKLTDNFQLVDFKPKRKAENGGTGESKRPKTDENSSVDVKQLAKDGKLSKLTVPILKAFMQSNKISASYGTKKDDLIAAINAHLKC